MELITKIKKKLNTLLQMLSKILTSKHFLFVAGALFLTYQYTKLPSVISTSDFKSNFLQFKKKSYQDTCFFQGLDCNVHNFCWKRIYN